MYSDYEREGVLDDETTTKYLVARDEGLIKRSNWRRMIGLHLILPLSITLNVLLIINTVFSTHLSVSLPALESTKTPDTPHQSQHAALEDANASDLSTSKYAKLPLDFPMTWVDESKYFGTTATTELDSDAAWDSINIDNGTIALSDEYAEAMGLPYSERFPWDDTKGIYHINAFHDLHCLKGIRSWIQTTRRGESPHIRIHHVLHCIDQLRQTIECHADDTPRYSGFQHQFRTGTNQTRMCRDWNKLEAWAQENTACFRYLHDKHSSMNLIGEYAYCPEGSPYQEKVDAYFAGQKDHKGY